MFTWNTEVYQKHKLLTVIHIPAHNKKGEVKLKTSQSIVTALTPPPPHHGDLVSAASPGANVVEDTGRVHGGQEPLGGPLVLRDNDLGVA